MAGLKELPQEPTDQVFADLSRALEVGEPMTVSRLNEICGYANIKKVARAFLYNCLEDYGRTVCLPMSGEFAEDYIQASKRPRPKLVPEQKQALMLAAEASFWVGTIIGSSAGLIEVFEHVPLPVW